LPCFSLLRSLFWGLLLEWCCTHTPIGRPFTSDFYWIPDLLSISTLVFGMFRWKLTQHPKNHLNENVIGIGCTLSVRAHKAAGPLRLTDHRCQMSRTNMVPFSGPEIHSSVRSHAWRLFRASRDHMDQSSLKYHRTRFTVMHTGCPERPRLHPNFNAQSTWGSESCFIYS
jgi:hypothetical protein